MDRKATVDANSLEYVMEYAEKDVLDGWLENNEAVEMARHLIKINEDLENNEKVEELQRVIEYWNSSDHQN